MTVHQLSHTGQAGFWGLDRADISFYSCYSSYSCSLGPMNRKRGIYHQHHFLIRECKERWRINMPVLGRNLWVKMIIPVEERGFIIKRLI